MDWKREGPKEFDEDTGIWVGKDDNGNFIISFEDSKEPRHFAQLTLGARDIGVLEEYLARERDLQQLRQRVLEKREQDKEPEPDPNKWLNGAQKLFKWYGYDSIGREHFFIRYKGEIRSLCGIRTKLNPKKWNIVEDGDTTDECWTCSRPLELRTRKWIDGHLYYGNAKMLKRMKDRD